MTKIGVEMDNECKQKTGPQRENKREQRQTKIGTWNVQGIFEEGAVKNLVSEIRKYNIDILAIQETHLTGSGITKVGDYIMFTSGNQQRRYGVGFLVRESLKGSIKEFNPVSERLCYIRIKGKCKNLTIINIHAPTEVKTDDEKDKFYEEMERVYQKLPKREIKLVIGDANAQVGKELIYRNITGGQSKHNNSNDNGVRLISFAAQYEMKIMSTYFMRKDIYKGTWISPGGDYINQIDHVLIEKQYASLVTNVRTYRGADSNSDHYLIGTKIKKEMKHHYKTYKPRGKRYNMEALQNKDGARSYKKAIHIKTEDLSWNPTDPVERKWEMVESIIKEATAENVPLAKQEMTKSWMNQECKVEIEKRKRLRIKMLQSKAERDKLAYIEQRKKTKKWCRQLKRLHSEKELEGIEQNMKNNELRKAYKNIRREKGELQPRTIYCKDKEGRLVGEEEEQLKVWKEYFQDILNPMSEEQLDEMVEEGTSLAEVVEGEGMVNPPTREELERVVGKLKNNKTPGKNGITAENIKYGGPALVQIIYEMIKEVWEKEVMPREWSKAIVHPIHKKGDKAECNNYRGIALLDTVYKVTATLIKQRLEECAGNRIGEYQGGFRKGRGTVDQIFLLKHVMEGCYEYKIPLNILFIDFQKAYDSVNRKKLYAALKDLSIPPKIIRLVKMSLKASVNHVKVNGSLTEEFTVNTGLRQGDPLSTLLFNLVLERIIQETGIKREGTIRTNTHQCIAYADDVVLLARNKKELLKITTNLINVAGKYGLKVNAGKSKFMQVATGQDENIRDDYTVRLQSGNMITFENVKDFIYLGVYLTNKCHEVKEVERRIAKANKSAGALNQVLRAKNISFNSKLRIYKSVIKPIALYGCETWVLNKCLQNTIETWERKLLRRIFGGRKTDQGWERRTNAEIYGMYKGEKITDTIKVRRLQWLGHLGRMPENRVVKGIAWKKMEGTRKRGRPRRKWWEAVQQDLQDKGIKNWKEKAKERKEWKKLITQRA